MDHGMFGFVSGPRPLALAQSVAPPENSALMEIAGPWNRLPRPITVLSLFGLGRRSPSVRVTLQANQSCMGRLVFRFLPQAATPFRIRGQNIKEAWSSQCLNSAVPGCSARSQTVLFANTANQLPSRVDKAGLTH